MKEAIRILLADDDEEDQELFTEAITNISPGATVLSFKNGRALVSQLEQCSVEDLPGLIILDYKMPILNGVEALKLINADPRFAGIPKAVWSSSKQGEHVKNSLDNGALQYFVKPNSDAELMHLAQVLLAMYRKE